MKDEFHLPWIMSPSSIFRIIFLIICSCLIGVIAVIAFKKGSSMAAIVLLLFWIIVYLTPVFRGVKCTEDGITCFWYPFPLFPSFISWEELKKVEAVGGGFGLHGGLLPKIKFYGNNGKKILSIVYYYFSNKDRLIFLKLLKEKAPVAKLEFGNSFLKDE